MIIEVYTQSDMTVKNRLEVFTLKEHTYEHQAQPMSGSKRVTLGQSYSTIVWVPEVEGSWASIKKITPAFAAISIKPAIAGLTARTMLTPSTI